MPDHTAFRIGMASDGLIVGGDEHLNAADGLKSRSEDLSSRVRDFLAR
jgi:hypothetical protein